MTNLERCDRKRRVGQMILKDKKILIMGIRNKWSIAWGAAQSAHEQGAEVIFTYHGTENVQKIEDLVSEIPRSKIYPCDVTDDNEVEELFSIIEKEHGKIDGVLHSIAHANMDDLRNGMINTSKEGFKHAHDVSAYSFVAVCRYAKKVLNPGGSLVALTYYGADKVMQGYNVMGAAKAALQTSVMYLSQDLGVDNIRVNAISAGPIKTLSAKAIKDFNVMLEMVEERSPLRRNVTQKEVGDVATFLFSELSSSITGQTIFSDNGMSIMGI